MGENKDFQDLKVQPTDEQYDTRHVAEEGELVKNEQEAEFKINLSDVKLAKPEIAGQEERQEIPLEYRDIMR